MIICSCNRLSDKAVHEACLSGRAERVTEVYKALGCAPQCGRCASTMAALLKEAKANGCICRPGDCGCAEQEAAQAA